MQVETAKRFEQVDKRFEQLTSRIDHFQTSPKKTQNHS
jgi:hypothetical protein